MHIISSILVLLSLYGLPCFSSPFHTFDPGPKAGIHWPRATLRARNATENVVLADCLTGTGGIVSSQMAYYPGPTGPTPADVAVVNTTPGQAALWVNGNTSGLFTDTGVVFTADLGPKVSEGSYAGTGNNGYTDFVCWQIYVPDLYVYGGTTCSQVYDCNHSPAPGATSGPSGSTPVASGGSTTGTSAPRNGLSIGAVVGISIGSAVAFLIILGVLIFVWIRRRRASAKSDPSPQPAREEHPRPDTAPPAGGIWDTPREKEDFKDTPSNAVHEMATADRFEVGEGLRPELDEHRREELADTSPVSDERKMDEQTVEPKVIRSTSKVKPDSPTIHVQDTEVNEIKETGLSDTV